MPEVNGRNTSRKRIKQMAFVVVTIVGLFPRLMILASDIRFAINYIPDDAFYYFQTARNLVGGGGVTFDGLHPTNGFHPLWMLALLPVAHFIADPDVVIQAVLFLTIALNFLSAWLLYRFLRYLVGRVWLALLGLGLYYLNLKTIFTSVNGLETSLATSLFMVAIILAYWRPLERWRGGRAHSWVMGTVLGLLFLARTDTLFYILPLLLFEVERQYVRQHRRAVKSVVIIFLMMFLVVFPWFLWNWIEFGSLMQVSGKAVPFVLHENYVNDGEVLGSIWQASAIRLLAFLLGGRQGFLFIIYLATLIFCFWVFLRVRKNTAVALHGSGWLRLLVWLWGGGFLLIVVHVSIRWFPRLWYFDQMTILSSLTAVTTLAFLIQNNRPQRQPLFRKLANRIPFAAPAGFALIIAVAAYVLIRGIYNAPYAHQIEMLDAALWLEQNTPEDAVTAAFNAGIIGYFSHRTTLNLDGVMNNESYAAIVDHQLFSFLEKSGVDYYADYDPVMLEQYRIFIGPIDLENYLTLVATIDHPGVDFRGDPINIFRINWPDNSTANGNSQLFQRG